MSNIDLNNPCHVYFMGIGGISMSGFAHLLHSTGFNVSGSDTNNSSITKHLEEEGIHINVVIAAYEMKGLLYTLAFK